MEDLPQTPGNQTAFTGVFLDRIRSRSLRAYRTPDLREHVLNTVLIETPRGIRLAKEKASRKIDGAVALAMAVWACHERGSQVSETSRVYSMLEMAIADHQQESLSALYGTPERVPEYAIDR